MCVLEAVEKAVYDLIIEGLQDGIWNLKYPEDINSPAIQNYLKEKQETEKIITYDQKGRVIKVEDVTEPEEVQKPEPEQLEKPEPEEIEKPKPEQIEKRESEVTKKWKWEMEEMGNGMVRFTKR